LAISPACPEIPKTTMQHVLRVCVFFFCCYQIQAQTWPDYQTGSDCFFWPNAEPPFNDLKGYILRHECATIKIIPCNATCTPSLNCDVYADICTDAIPLLTNQPYVISRPNLTIQGASELVRASFVMYSQSNNYYNITAASCGNAFIVNDKNVNFKFVDFIVDPACKDAKLSIQDTTPLVYNQGGEITLSQITLNPAGPIYNSAEKINTLALFINTDLKLTIDSVVTQADTYSFFLLNVSGTFHLDGDQLLFLIGSATHTGTNTKIFNISSFIPTPAEFECPAPTRVVETKCNSIAKTNYILEIVVGVLSGLLGALGLAYAWESFHHKHVNLD
jgi:hypothetical protein